MNPKVSICIPTYNYASYLPEAIESVLKQSYDDYELIIIDDCSTDDSHRIIEHYATQDDRIISRINHANRGMVSNWNLCLQTARGVYIKYLFGDDAFYSNKALGKMVFALEESEDIALVSTARNVIDEKSQIVEVKSEYKGNRGYAGTDIIQDCLIEQNNKIGEPSVVMFRKKHAVRGFDEKYRQIADLEMWFHILEQGRFAFIDEPLCSFRIHPCQQTRINMAYNDFCKESFQLIQDYSNKPYLHLSSIEREYMLYIPVYSIWKQYKKGRISQTAALDEINKHSGIYKFILYLPIYRFYKFLKRLRKKLIPKK